MASKVDVPQESMHDVIWLLVHGCSLGFVQAVVVNKYRLNSAQVIQLREGVFSSMTRNAVCCVNDKECKTKFCLDDQFQSRVIRSNFWQQ